MQKGKKAGSHFALPLSGMTPDPPFSSFGLCDCLVRDCVWLVVADRKSFGKKTTGFMPGGYCWEQAD
jgi:hypothetical protein